jgi:hypothetical protein
MSLLLLSGRLGKRKLWSNVHEIFRRGTDTLIADIRAGRLS